MFKKNLSFFLLLFSITVFGQDKFWITFADKDTQNYSYQKYLSNETIRNRMRYGLPLFQYTDVPVNPLYVDSLSKMGIRILAKSKWLNSVSAILTSDQIVRLENLSFVKEISGIDRRIQITGSSLEIESSFFIPALKQMQVEAFYQRGLSGKGVSIGVIDAGFYKAYTDKVLSHLFEEGKIIQQKDFLSPAAPDLVRDTVVIKDSDHHGRIVLSFICGYNAAEKVQIGMAVNSNFYLARSEDESKEHRGEEDNWIMAMEWMDSMGVRLINTSLGYSINMDDPKDNYKKEEMDGKTARISKAAQIAYDEKGIFLVVSAGNEGRNKDWKIISAPADAEGVLTVGATKGTTWEKIDYSSIGPDFLPYLKPNVASFSLYGTSFSAPAITGFVACLMERDSMLSNKELKEIVEKSGHLYPYGNNFVGYGIPQAGKALMLIDNKNHEFGNFSEKNSNAKKIIFRVDPGMGNEAVLFHKKNKYIVIQQQTINVYNGKVRVRRIPGAKFTTVSVGLEVFEIKWE
jgi:hypothetical protein